MLELEGFHTANSKAKSATFLRFYFTQVKFEECVFRSANGRRPRFTITDERLPIESRRGWNAQFTLLIAAGSFLAGLLARLWGWAAE